MNSIDKSLGDIIRAKDKNSKYTRRNKNAPYRKRNYVGRRNNNNNNNNNNNRFRNNGYRPFDHENQHLKVSQHTEAKKLAGKINSIVINGDPPQIYSIGVDSTNQAVKAIAISRRNLQYEKIDVLVQPRFQRAEGSGPGNDSYIFALRKGPARRLSEAETDMKISSTGDPGVIAGAISAKVKDSCRVSLQGIGAAAVNVMVKSVVFARKYLLDDGIDVGFRPEFSHFDVKGEEKVGITLHIFSQQN